MDESFLDLSPRVEGTRDRQIAPILKFELDEIKSHFEEELEAIRKEFDVFTKLKNDGDDVCAKLILKSQIVLLESAFDFYLHELTKYGVSKIFDGSWNKTEKYKKILIKLDIVERVVRDEVTENWFFEFVNDYYVKETMVSFDAIKDKMNLLGLNLKDVADEVFYEQNSNNSTMDKMKCFINKLYNRRNIIAHQSNREHGDASHYAITKVEVTDCIEKIEKIVNAIHKFALELN